MSLADRLPHADTDPRRHGLVEDAFALATGTLLVALGFHMFKLAGLATGGTAGVAFLIHYATGLPLSAVFFVANLPFYVFAWMALGRTFTLRTFLAVAVLSVETALLPRVVTISAVDPVYAAVMGGLQIGVGMLVLFRHKASLGGFGVMALWLQETRGWRAGTVQMALDAVVVAAALWVLDPMRIALSILGVVALNLVLAINHRPGRYSGF